MRRRCKRCRYPIPERDEDVQWDVRSLRQRARRRYAPDPGYQRYVAVTGAMYRNPSPRRVAIWLAVMAAVLAGVIATACHLGRVWAAPTAEPASRTAYEND